MNLKEYDLGGGPVSRVREETNSYGILAGKLEKKIPRGRSRHRREDNIKVG
jgi:hypothetical protein